MKAILCFIKDLLKCIIIGLGISVVVLFISWVISLIMYKGDVIVTLNGAKRFIYFMGIFGMFLSAGFFIQRNATRPLSYSEEWKEHFQTINLGFVIMFISLFLCSIGMILQNNVDKMGGL